MRHLGLTLAVLAALSAGQALAGIAPKGGLFSEGTELGHGGGCRKSSPPGKCCHMQKSTGKVHCH